MRHPLRLLTTLLAAAALIAPAAAGAAVTHSVRRGETLTSIAAADGLSVARLAAANGLSPDAELIAGTELVIPAQGGPLPTAASASVAPSAPEGGEETAGPVIAGGYLVQPGDTLSAIAARLGTSARALAAENAMPVNGLLLAGRTLRVPGATAAAPAVAPPAPASGAQPVAQFVSPAEVGSIATAGGVPAPLAEAIADQESGFNDGLVSSSGATGVMQLEPGTWNDLARVDGLSLSPTSALDNVRGGVAVLHWLLGATGGNEQLTIAAYYQGLQSVQSRGILPATRRYLADVTALEGRFGG
jgi:soluble lytic murein transglycosylase-like protein